MEMTGYYEMKKCYSHNGEEYSYDDFAQAAMDLANELMSDEIGVIYEAEVIEKRASQYLPSASLITDIMTDNAWDDVSEYSESWLSKLSREQLKDLSERMKVTVDEWAEKNGLKPTFYGARLIREIQIKAVEDEEGFSDFVRVAEAI